MAKFSDDDDVVFLPLDSTDSRFNLLKTDSINSLFKDDRYVPQKMISVRRIELTKGRGENWEILEDSDIVLIMKGTRFTKNEKVFLRSLEGMKFIIFEYKNGNESVVKLKKQMKNKMKAKS